MHFFRKRQTRDTVEQLIRRGVGVREASWEFTADGGRELLDSIVEWLQAAMGEMRRPYGLDQVAVALACRDGEGRVLCSNSLGVLRPGAFYGESGSDRIAAFLDDVKSVPRGQRHEIVGAVLSLGDIAHEMNFARVA
jgi:hypothetical protein